MVQQSEGWARHAAPAPQNRGRRRVLGYIVTFYLHGRKKKKKDQELKKQVFHKASMRGSSVPHQATYTLSIRGDVTTGRMSRDRKSNGGVKFLG